MTRKNSRITVSPNFLDFADGVRRDMIKSNGKDVNLVDVTNKIAEDLMNYKPKRRKR